MDLSVYDSRDSACVPAPSPFPRSSLTHAHRCIGYRNTTWHIMPKSARLMYLSVYVSRLASTPSPLPSPLVTSPPGQPGSVHTKPGT